MFWVESCCRRGVFFRSLFPVGAGRMISFRSTPPVFAASANHEVNSAVPALYLWVPLVNNGARVGTG